jgi:hypothetical protein
MVGRWIIFIVVLAFAIFAVYPTPPAVLLERLTAMIDRALSPDALTVLLDQYALFAIGMLVVFAAGLFLWKKLRKIEVQLDNLQEEVSRLNLIEARRFLVGLNSSEARQGTRAAQRARAGPPLPAAPPARAHSHSSGETGDAKFERAESSKSSIVPEIADSESTAMRNEPGSPGQAR